MTGIRRGKIVIFWPTAARKGIWINIKKNLIHIENIQLIPIMFSGVNFL